MTTTLAPSPVDALVEAFSPASLDTLTEDELRARMDDARRLEGLAAVAMARVVDRLTRAGAPRRDGASSVNGWVQQQTGRSSREASRLVRMASGLDALPRTAAAVAAGDVTPESADVLLGAVRDGRLGDAAEVDTTLASAARLPADQLRGVVRRRVAARDGAALRRDERRQHALRRASITRLPDGMTRLDALLPSEAGERLRVALDALDRPDPEDTPDDQRRTSVQRTADALDELARRSLVNGDGPRTGGLVPQVTVNVDLSALETDLDGEAPPAWDDPRWAGAAAGRTNFGQDLSPQVVRRMVCDAVVTRVVTDGRSSPIEVGRATRRWSGAQRRAANARDLGCRGPSCDRPAPWTQLHHVTWWRHGGRTDLDNALSLCHACHTLVHDDGWDLVLDPTTADVTWTAPDGRIVVARARARPRPG